MPRNAITGKGPRAEMIRWQEGSPEEFERTYRQRGMVESAFSPFRCRFATVVRTKTLLAQRMHLLLRCACCNP